jgi:hypothetical protein
MALSTTEKHVAGQLLDAAADEFSNHGCNDLILDNTDENWQLIQDMHAWNRTPPADLPERPAPDEKIWTNDWFVMRFLSVKLLKEANDE